MYGGPPLDDPWAAKGACLDADPELFFPEARGSAKAAKAVCATCSVKIDCLTAAIERRESFGVWGGASVREREKIRKASSLP